MKQILLAGSHRQASTPTKMELQTTTQASFTEPKVCTKGGWKHQTARHQMLRTRIGCLTMGSPSGNENHTCHSWNYMKLHQFGHYTTPGFECWNDTHTWWKGPRGLLLQSSHMTAHYHKTTTSHNSGHRGAKKMSNHGWVVNFTKHPVRCTLW